MKGGPPGLHFARKMVSAQEQLAKLPGWAGGAACSPRQPGTEADVQEVAGERFSQGSVVWLLRLYQCSGY